MQSFIDPTHLTALHSLDLGSIYSDDGREHPITGFTPVYFEPADATDVPQVALPTATTAGATVQTPGGTLQPLSFSIPFLDSLVSKGKNALVRLVLIILAILIIALVVWRIIK